MWRLRGFRTHVFAFGWEDTASNYHEKQTCLNDYARSLDGDVYLIGASADGMAALHALAGDNGKIRRHQHQSDVEFCVVPTSF